ncbi:MAG TPA: Gfo/Idh/MocA family oxidoreductase [Pirellulales bacterium]|nr:Gfo/Idh/MocA family oxidoreductase [Pirellulales bacterium]
MSERIRLAVIGAGHLGRIHARLAQQAPGFELVGMVDPMPEARRLAKAECHVPVLADYQELIGQIDAAVVATPTQFHHSVSLSLLSHGIHLMVEKPLATTLAEADEILAVAQQHGAMVQVGHIERFNPAWNQANVMPLVRQPKYIEASRCSGYTFRSTDIGVVLDLMIHDLDLALHFANSPVRRVQALGISVLGDHEDVAQARLEFANGCVANLSASRISYKPQRHMQVWSDQGCVTFDFATRTAVTVCPVTELLQREFDLDDIGPASRAHLKDHLFEDLFQLEHYAAAEQNALLEELNDFAASIREHKEPRVTGLQGRNVLAVAEQVLEAIQRHAWDGAAEGRTGPLAMPTAPILRGPHWSLGNSAPVERRREAG